MNPFSEEKLNLFEGFCGNTFNVFTISIEGLLIEHEKIFLSTSFLYLLDSSSLGCFSKV